MQIQHQFWNVLHNMNQRNKLNSNLKIMVRVRNQLRGNKRFEHFQLWPWGSKQVPVPQLAIPGPSQQSLFHHAYGLIVFLSTIRSSHPWANNSSSCGWGIGQVWWAQDASVFSKLSVDCWGRNCLESGKWLLQIYPVKDLVEFNNILLKLCQYLFESLVWLRHVHSV